MCTGSHRHICTHIQQEGTSSPFFNRSCSFIALLFPIFRKIFPAASMVADFRIKKGVCCRVKRQRKAWNPEIPIPRPRSSFLGHELMPTPFHSHFSLPRSTAQPCTLCAAHHCHHVAYFGVYDRGRHWKQERNNVRLPSVSYHSCKQAVSCACIFSDGVSQGPTLNSLFLSHCTLPV